MKNNKTNLISIVKVLVFLLIATLMFNCSKDSNNIVGNDDKPNKDYIVDSVECEYIYIDYHPRIHKSYHGVDSTHLRSVRYQRINTATSSIPDGLDTLFTTTFSRWICDAEDIFQMFNSNHNRFKMWLLSYKSGKKIIKCKFTHIDLIRTMQLGIVTEGVNVGDTLTFLGYICKDGTYFKVKK